VSACNVCGRPTNERRLVHGLPPPDYFLPCCSGHQGYFGVFGVSSANPHGRIEWRELPPAPEFTS